MKMKIRDKNAAIQKIIIDNGYTEHEAIMEWNGMSQKDRKRYINKMGKVSRKVQRSIGIPKR